MSNSYLRAMQMDNLTITLSVIIVILFTLLVYALFYIQKQSHKMDVLKMAPKTEDLSKLRLMAYERLALVAERTRLNNLITRLHQSQFTAKEMQSTLINAIREEYDYNLSQQLYVKPEIWEALTKMKEQNIYIVNQLAATLPQEANSMELNKRIIELMNANPNATMNNVLLDALQFEVKQML